MAKKRCCKYHENLFFEETDLTECGHSGMGTPIVCCHECPENIYPEGEAIYYATDTTMRDERALWAEYND